MSNKFTNEQCEQVIAELLDPSEIIAYRPGLARALGSINAALFLSQAIFWQRVAEKADNDSFYKFKMAETDDFGNILPPSSAYRQSWEYELGGMGRREQDSARKILKRLKLLTEVKKGIHSPIHYKVNMGNLREFILNNQQSVRNAHSIVAETHTVECADAPLYSVQNEHCITENTNTENTQITQQQLQPAKNAGVVEVDDVNKISREKTLLALKAQYQIPDVNASNKDFIDLCELGLVTQDFLDAASTINDKSKRKFNYVLKVAKSRLNEASKSSQKPFTSGESKAGERGKKEMPKWIKDLNLEENAHLYE